MINYFICSTGDVDVRSARSSFMIFHSADSNCGSWSDRSRAIVLKRFPAFRPATSLLEKQYDDPSLLCCAYSRAIVCATADFPDPAMPVKRHICGASSAGLLRMSQISRMSNSRVPSRHPFSSTYLAPRAYGMSFRSTFSAGSHVVSFPITTRRVWLTALFQSIHHTNHGSLSLHHGNPSLQSLPEQCGLEFL